MSAKDKVDAILRLLEIVVSWPVAILAIIFWFRRELGGVLPELGKRISKAPGGWEFHALQEVSAEVASLVNQTEIARDENRLDETKVDPKAIRLKHSSKHLDAKYWSVKVWLDAPEDFLSQVEKVTFQRHPTFIHRFKETTTAPFEDSFSCWGEFTIKAEIKTRSGQVFRRQRYLTLDTEQDQNDT